MNRQPPKARKARKALRSAAARKGWETRRMRATLAEVRASNDREDQWRAEMADPNPWPRLAAMVRGWWQRATGWLR